MPVDIIILVIWLAGSIWRALRLLQILQIEEYEISRYLRWLFKPRLRFFDVKNLVTGAVIIIILMLFLGDPSSTIGLSITVSLSVVALFQLPRRQVKLPLVPTARMVTLIMTISILTAILIFGPSLLLGWAGASLTFWLWLIVVYQLVSLVIVVGNTLLKPLEVYLKRRQVAQARAIMQAYKGKVIGITGSFGKTSTKEFLYHILSSKYNVLKTPKSFNTPLGISQVVRGSLAGNQAYDYFIVEMGAYLPGNIKTLCEIAFPDYGLLTAIGPAHLERFGSIDAILNTKMELIQSLPSDGIAVFNADYPRLVERAKTTTVEAVRLIGVQNQAVDLHVSDITASSAGLSFDVHQSNGASVNFQIPLLGQHNVSNVLMVTALLLELGFTLEEIAQAARTLPPVEHRLQLIRRSGITIIDDSYNSNPEGAKQALEALALFNQGQKILVTPGFAELGSAEVEAHEQLGRQAAEVCDRVYLVSGKRTKPIETGLLAGGFTQSRIHAFKTLTEATDDLWKRVLPGDTILFLNDLPDTYG